MSNLNEIAKKYGTDKSSEVHNYCDKYAKYINGFERYSEFKFLEIGVLDGDSLKTWKEYFYRAQITGIDINPDCAQYAQDGINVEIGDQTDPEFLKRVVEKHGPFDLIIDDGSHINEHVIFSFKELFPTLKEKGTYIVEDCGTSYWDNYGGGRYKPGSTIEYFKGLADEVNFFGEYQENEEFGIHWRREDGLIPQFIRKGYDYIGTGIESLNFLNGIIIITKR
jgi:hypothetical protein